MPRQPGESYAFAHIVFIAQHECKLNSNRVILFHKFRINILLYTNALIIAGANGIKNSHIFLPESSSPVRRKVLRSHNIYGDPKASTTLSNGDHI